MTRLGGRPAVGGVIRGRYALSVGDPGGPTPPGWRWTALTSVARLETGHTPSRRHPEYWDGDIPWVGIRDATAHHGRTLDDTAQHTNALGIANSSARVLPAGTVCLSRTASVGYVVVLGRPMATSQDFVGWVCDPGALDHRYLKYVLLAERDSFLAFASGTTHQTIYLPEVKAFHVCLPPLAEQRAIADTLDALDDLAANAERRTGTLERMADAVYRERFVRRRPEGSVPGTLADLATEVRRPVTPSFDTKAMRYVPLDAIEPRALVLRRFRPGDDAASSLRLFERGDVLFGAMRAYFHKVCLAPFGGVTRSTCLVLRPAPERHLYTALTLAQPATVAYAAAHSTGSTIPYVRWAGALDRMPVAIPPLAVAAAFEAEVRPLVDAAQRLVPQVWRLAEMRDLLLPRLVSGRVDVADLDRLVGSVA